VNIIAVDDEQYALAGLKTAIEETMSAPSAKGITLSCFSNAEEALEYAKTKRVDTAFLDIEMGGMNGLQLARELKEIYGKTYIVFVTGYPQYAVEAFAIRAKGYIMKPYVAEAVAEALCEATAYLQTEKKLFVQTFGNFEIFLDGTPLKFSRKKTKELFAYLVSRRGAECSHNEIIDILWDDEEDKNILEIFRKLVLDLSHRLDEAGFSDILIKRYGMLAIVPDKIPCDYYDFCAGININNYMGEFMSQYRWAEFTNTYLDEKYKKQ
jgi:two-component SAPR family response regulator